MANTDIVVRNTMPVADWSSEIMKTNAPVNGDQSPKVVCFSLSMMLRSYVSSISAVMIYLNASSSQTIQSKSLMQLSVNQWTSEADSELIKEVNDSFEVSLAGIHQYQVRLRMLWVRNLCSRQYRRRRK